MPHFGNDRDGLGLYPLGFHLVNCFLYNNNLSEALISWFSFEAAFGNGRDGLPPSLHKNITSLHQCRISVTIAMA